MPKVFGDELTHGEAARNLALHGSLATQGYGFVTPLIDALGYLVTANGVSALALWRVREPLRLLRPSQLVC